MKLSVKEYDRYQRQLFEKLVVEMKSKREIIASLGITKKVYNRWLMRLSRKGTTELGKKGFPSKLQDEHIEFLKDWLSRQGNIGNSFTAAFNALKENFLIKNPVRCKLKNCYKQFSRRSGFSYKKI